MVVGFDFVDDAMRRDEGIFTLSRVRYCMSIRRSVVVVVVFCFFFEKHALTLNDFLSLSYACNANSYIHAGWAKSAHVFTER